MITNSKHLGLILSLVLASALPVFAAEPATAAPPACTAPTVSTTQPGYLVADPARPQEDAVVRVPQSRIAANFDHFRVALVELRDLLSAHAPEQGWADWADRTLIRTEARDAGGFDYWISAYGGMGSINDLSIDWAGRLTPDESSAVYERITELRGRCYALASQIRVDLAENVRVTDPDQVDR